MTFARAAGAPPGASPWLAPARAIEADLVAWRRHLHRHPEVAFEEHATTAFLAAEVERMGLGAVRRTPTGLWVDLDGQAAGPGRRVLVRADIDALPLAEATNLPFASERPGVAHACGHDAHAAMALGCLRLLSAARGRLVGGVRVVFQPAEEAPPGGARQMIEAGVLEGVAVAIGLHVFAVVPGGWRATGQASIAVGPAAARSAAFRLVLRGRGGHGAAPQDSVDAIAVAARTVDALQHVVSRSVDPLRPAVLTVGTIRGGFAPNVLAATVELGGTVRTFDAATEDRVLARLAAVARETAAAFGAAAEVEVVEGYPALVNDAATAAVLGQAAAAVLGARGVHPSGPVTQSDDFARYAERVPAALLWLGAGDPARGSAVANHDPRFSADEAALPLGAAVLAEAVERLARATA